MRILCISDTHQRQDRLDLIECDVLLISGDVCSSGDISQLDNFLTWLITQEDKFRKAFIIAGNHDWCWLKNKTRCLLSLEQRFGDKVEYLEDSEFVFEGLKFYGSPWQPAFNNWAFNLPRGESLVRRWDNIPSDVNVLMTHCPPHGIGDCISNRHVGCADLAHRVRELPSLLLHVFGHIHDGNGCYISEAIPGVQFCNAAICDEQYDPIQNAHLFTLTDTGTHYHIINEEHRIDRIKRHI